MSNIFFTHQISRQEKPKLRAISVSKKRHPKHLIWDTKTRANSNYWIEQKTPSGIIDVSTLNNIFSIAQAYGNIRIWIDPNIIDVNQPVMVKYGDEILFSRKVFLDSRAIAKSIMRYNAPKRIYFASIDVSIPIKPRDMTKK